MTKTTGLVLTLNGERLLERCLRSLDFCDEILVVDSESTDRTVEIAEQCGARVLVNPWPGPVDQFRFALENIDDGWIVNLDQDEIFDDTLRQSVQQAIADPGDKVAFEAARSTWYFDRFMRHSGWYPDYQLRLFRKGGAELRTHGPHYGWYALGPSGRLDGDILHYSYRNFSEHLQKIDYYAEQGAAHLRGKGRKGGVFPAITHGAGRFMKLYVFKLGLLDGRAGFINAVTGAYYAFQKYIRVEEDGYWGD